MCCLRARAAGWGVSGGSGGCAVAPAERALLARCQPQRMGPNGFLSPPAPGADAGWGCLLGCWQLLGGFSPSRRLQRPWGGMGARHCAPRQFRERGNAGGSHGTVLEVWTGEVKQGHPYPVDWGEPASCLHPLLAKVGGRGQAAGPGGDLRSRQRHWWGRVLARAFLNQG